MRKRKNLRTRVNSLFSVKRQFMSNLEDKKEVLPIENDEKSSEVAEGGIAFNL